jgi:predicted nucleotidyltransferase
MVMKLLIKISLKNPDIQLHKIKDQIKRLKTFFSSQKREHSIELAYLFGSRADGTEGPISDYDIAVLFSKVPLPEVTYRMAHNLATLLKTEGVDLVVLNRAPIELRCSVIATGIVIYEVSTFVRVEFEANTLSRYGDYLPILRRQRHEILEERYHETGIQRYRKAFRKTQRLLEQIRAV